MIILKILLWIILAVLGIILLILLLPFKAELSYVSSKFTYKIKYWFLPLLDSDGNGIAAKFLKSENKENKDDNAGENTTVSEVTQEPENVSGEINESAEIMQEIEKTEGSSAKETKKTGKINKSQPEQDEIKQTEEKSLMDKIEFIINMWNMAERPVLRIFKGIKIRKICIDFAVANEDAYKCAVNYGRISGGIYNILAWLSLLFTVKFKTVDILPEFASDKSKWDISAEISLNLMTLVISGIWFLIIYSFKVIIPKKRKMKKSVK